MTASPLKTQIVVVGGGVGGLELVRRLGLRFGRKHHDVILVESNRTHIWKPLLHEVAAGSLDANLDEVGYREHCHRWGYRFFNGTLESIDRDQREIVIAPLLDDDGTELFERHRIRYDVLVLAVGSVTNDFGTPGARDYCLFLDNRAQADRFRNRLLNHCLRVSRRMSADPASNEHVRVIIVGGGATGVELAAEVFNAASALKYYGLEVFDEGRLKVTLIEAGPRILPALPENLALAVTDQLETLGVRVLIGTKIVQAVEGKLLTQTGEQLVGDLMVWAAGVRGAADLAGIGGLETTPSCQLIVRSTLQSSRDDRIFAIGDCCFCKTDGMAFPIPPRAQAATQMAKVTYQNIVRLLNGQPLYAFVYHDRGSLVSLSRYSTVGNLMGNLIGGRMAIEGRLARLVYLSLYRMHLLAIHGWVHGLTLILLGKVNAIVRPRLKLH